MKMSKIKNFILIILSVICLSCVAVFSIASGLSFGKKNTPSFVFTSKEYNIRYGESYVLKKGNFNLYNELDYQVAFQNEAFGAVDGITSSSLKPGDVFHKYDIIAKIGESAIVADNDGVVINYSEGHLDYYYFNCFDIVLLLDMVDYKTINYESGTFLATINGTEYNLYYKSVDLTSVGSEGLYKVHFKTNNCFEIVRPSSVSSVKIFVTFYQNALYFDNAKLFHYDGEFKMFHYKDNEYHWKEVTFVTIVKIGTNWIVEPSAEIEAGTILYV